MNNFEKFISLQKCKETGPHPLTGTGTLVYDPRRGGKVSGKNWCVVNLYDDTPRYYQKLIAMEYGVPFPFMTTPSWGSHVSVIRGEKLLKNSHLWKKYEGKKVTFKYSKDVYMTMSGFIFLDVVCKELTDIRDSFGLKSDWNFHLTLGKIEL